MDSAEAAAASDPETGSNLPDVFRKSEGIFFSGKIDPRRQLPENYETR
jgi:hypothetical protein